MTLREAIDSAARGYLYRLLSECRGNITRAAKIAGIGRRTLYARLERAGLKDERTRILRRMRKANVADL